MSRKAKVWWNKQKGAWCTELGGKRKTLATGWGSKKLAEEQLKALFEEQALLSSVQGRVSVARLCEEFLNDAQENLEQKTYESYRYACQKLVDFCGARDAHALGPMDINRFSISLKKTLNDTSRAIVLRTVQRCFNWGVQCRLIPRHELGKIRKPQPRTRDRFVTDEEFQGMLAGTNPRDASRRGAPFRRVLLAMDWTLCRPGELARLQWVNVHWDHDVAILPDHKTKRTGKPKIIPIIPKMKRLLQWMRKHTRSEYCFVNSLGEPWTISAIDQRMRHIVERTGLVHVVPYTIRHRAATKSILRTGDLKMTSLLLGHKSTATTERYTHLAQEHLVTFAKKAVG